MDLELELVAEGLGFPEGPVAMADGSVLFVAIDKQTLSRLKPDKTCETIAELPGGPNGVAIGPDGAAYVCNNGGVYSFVDFAPGVRVPGPRPASWTGGSIQRVDISTGEAVTLYESCNGERLMTPDDIVFDAHGGFWFSDSGLQESDGMKYGGLYYAKTDGSSIERAARIPMANGVGLSPDGNTIYVADTVFGRLWALAITEPGKVAGGPLPTMAGNVIQRLPGYQWLDSLKVEQSGKICVGTIFKEPAAPFFGGITVFAEDGTFEQCTVDDIFTTNLCFGGTDLMDVWITASSTGKIYKTRWPRPGLKLAYNA